jgi:hypothetical protein
MHDPANQMDVPLPPPAPLPRHALVPTQQTAPRRPQSRQSTLPNLANLIGTIIRTMGGPAHHEYSRLSTPPPPPTISKGRLIGTAPPPPTIAASASLDKHAHPTQGSGP